MIFKFYFKEKTTPTFAFYNYNIVNPSVYLGFCCNPYLSYVKTNVVCIGRSWFISILNSVFISPNSLFY